MRIEQHQEKNGFRFILSIQTLDSVSHKLLTEEPKLEESIKTTLWNTSHDVLNLLNHEKQVRKM